MSLFITSINSGSNGNCYYIGNESEAILVDAGISCREIEKRMKRLGLDMRKVKAIFVSHEHTDHVKGIPTLSAKYQVPVYITAVTLLHSGCVLNNDLAIPFFANEKIIVGSLVITPFPKMHDACDPYSFLISCDGICVGVFTDIGTACSHVIKHFKECHAAFLEANYDEEMLRSGAYPYHLKKRISGTHGHLSNTQALELFKMHKPSFMSHLFLSHLSQNNNCPDLVRELFNKHADGVKMIVASRYEETQVYHVALINHYNKRFKKRFAAPQLSFSFG